MSQSRTLKCPFAILICILLALLKTSMAQGIDFLHYTQTQNPMAPRIINTQYENQRKQLNPYNMTFDPPAIEELIEDDAEIVYFILNTTANSQGWSLTIRPDDTLVADITENKTLELTPELDNGLSNGFYSGSFEVFGKRLGLTNLMFYLHPTGSDWEDERAELIYDSYEVIVLREERLVDDIYRNGIIVFASLIYLGFGCQIDLRWMWSIVKRPVAPAIGVFCQFVVMPLLGFGVAQMLSLDDEYAFGLLAMSCSPGGGGSNVYAHLLRGDLDLSICMTCISTLLACAFMPFWMFTLGRFFIDPSRVVIPYGTIMRSLATIVLPLIVGLLIRRFIVKLADFLVKVTKPLSLFFILYMLTFGTYVNWYIFVIMVTVPEVIPAALLVPTFGFIAGYIIAYALRQGNKKSTTVSVETGYQNASIPIIMLQGNFQQPEGDLGAVMPVATAFFMQIPLYIWYAVLEIRDRCCKSQIEDESMVKDPEEGTQEVAITTDENDNTSKPDIVKKREGSAKSESNGVTITPSSFKQMDSEHLILSPLPPL